MTVEESKVAWGLWILRDEGGDDGGGDGDDEEERSRRTRDTWVKEVAIIGKKK